MPIIKNNTLIKGASGKWKKEYVYKQRGDQTFLAAMPEIDKNRIPTVKQEEVKDRFTSARYYAEAAMADPELKKFYASKVSNSNTPFNVAFKDFQRPPQVTSLETDKYTGVPGSVVLVKAKDDCKVTGVTVRIVSAAGILIEEGEAVFNTLRNGKWVYAATQNNPALAGCKVTAIAKDIPNNEGLKEVTL
jgi:hypothetical protein